MSCPEKELCQADMVSKKDMGINTRWVIGLFIVVGLAVGGTFINTLADTKDVPKLEEKIEEVSK